jgi:hypothetical protein
VLTAPLLVVHLLFSEWFLEKTDFKWTSLPGLL